MPGAIDPRVRSPRESLANGRLWLAFASMLFVSGITNVFPVFFPALLAAAREGPPPSPPRCAGLGGAVPGIGNDLGAAAGPWLSGALYDRTGSYLVIYRWAAGVGLVGLAMLAALVVMTRRGSAV
jgi:cyanate permease